MGVWDSTPQAEGVKLVRQTGARANLTNSGFFVGYSITHVLQAIDVANDPAAPE